VKVRLDPAKAFPEFYYYWFRSTEGQSSILAHASAVGVPGIAQPVAAVKSFRVPRPPLHTQRAIAEILGALDAKIGANDRVIRVTDELAATLTRAASDGRTVQLATIAEVVMGSSPPGTSYNEKGEGVPFYQGVRDFGARFPERRVWTTSPVRVAISGDTLISVRAPVGRANLANERMCIGRGVASLRSRNGHPYTLFHQVRLASDAWAPYEAEGTVFGSINKRQLEAITVCAIGSGGDDALEERLAAVEQRIAAALVESRQLAKTRDDLSPLLMSGRIRVRDAEKVAEEVV
jgi:type I restriction enzyme S subunit